MATAYVYSEVPNKFLNNIHMNFLEYQGQFCIFRAGILTADKGAIFLQFLKEQIFKARPDCDI
jgi:hypothetical protein